MSLSIAMPAPLLATHDVQLRARGDRALAERAKSVLSVGTNFRVRRGTQGTNDEDGAWRLRIVGHERLARAVAGGKTMRGTMVGERYALPGTHASQYLKQPTIRVRIDLVQRQTAQRLHIAVYDIVRRFAGLCAGVGTALAMGHGLGRDRRQVREQAEADRRHDRG